MPAEVLWHRLRWWLNTTASNRHVESGLMHSSMTINQVTVIQTPISESVNFRHAQHDHDLVCVIESQLRTALSLGQTLADSRLDHWHLIHTVMQSLSVSALSGSRGHVHVAVAVAVGVKKCFSKGLFKNCSHTSYYRLTLWRAWMPLLRCGAALQRGTLLSETSGCHTLSARSLTNANFGTNLWPKAAPWGPEAATRGSLESLGNVRCAQKNGDSREKHWENSKEKPQEKQKYCWLHGVLSTTFSMREMVEVACDFRWARKLFLFVAAVIGRKTDLNRMIRSALKPVLLGALRPRLFFSLSRIFVFPYHRRLFKSEPTVIVSCFSVCLQHKWWRLPRTGACFLACLDRSQILILNWIDWGFMWKSSHDVFI
jgi:hypothetical protein